LSYHRQIVFFAFMVVTSSMTLPEDDAAVLAI
jgi:hypothetical protein